MRTRIAISLISSATIVLTIAAAHAAEVGFDQAAKLYHQGQWQRAATAFAACAETAPDQKKRIEAHFYLGESLLQLEKYSKAREHYRLVLKHPAGKPYLLRALFRIGEASWLAGDLSSGEQLLTQFVYNFPHEPLAAQATAYLREIAQQEPSQLPLASKEPPAEASEEKILDEAAGLQREGQHDAALAAYRELFAQHRHGKIHAEALRRAARLHAQLSQFSESSQLYLEFRAKYPDSVHTAEVIAAQAWLDVQTGDFASAETKFQILHENFSQSAQALEATYWLALAAADKKDSTLASTYVDWLLDILSQAPSAERTDKKAKKQANKLWEQTLLLKCQLDATENRWQEVLERLTQVGEKFEQGPRKTRAYFWLAEASYRSWLVEDKTQSRQFKEALSNFDRLAEQTAKQNTEIEEPWTAIIPLRRAQLRSRRQQWTEVLKLLKNVEHDFPDFPQQHEVDYLRGRAYAGRGEMPRARIAYGRVLDNPQAKETETAAVAQWMIGDTFFHQNDFPRARQAYQKVIDRHDQPQWQARAALQAGKCLEREHNWPAARAHYSKALDKWQGSTSESQLQTRLNWANRQTTRQR